MCIQKYMSQHASPILYKAELWRDKIRQTIDPNKGYSVYFKRLVK